MEQGKQIVWLNGSYMDRGEASISPEDRGFLFADGVYEVVISYGGRIFRIEDHVARLRRSLGGISIKGVDAAILADIAPELVARNDLSDGDAIVYMQVTRGAAPRLHAFPAEGTPPTVYAFARRFRLPVDMIRDGTGIITVPDIRWTRCDIKSVSLLPNVLAKQKAEEEGAGEAVFVRDGALTEGTASNFAAVFGGSLVTHQDCGFILGGITKGGLRDLRGSRHPRSGAPRQDRRARLRRRSDDPKHNEGDRAGGQDRRPDRRGRKAGPRHAEAAEGIRQDQAPVKRPPVTLP